MSLSLRNRWIAVVVDQLGLLAVLALLIAYFAFTAEGFWAERTFISLANQIPATVVIAVGMTYVLIIAGIDLSVGSVLALSGVILAILMRNHHTPLLVAAAAALTVGLACGIVNGTVTVAWRLPSFIVTLGMLEIARGMAHVVSHVSINLPASAGRFADFRILSLSAPFYLSLILVAAGQFVLSRTVFGRYMVAVGTNEEVVRLSGIDPRPVKVAVFAIAGLLAALGAVINCSRNEYADPNSGGGLELNVIAAVVVGGTSLMGGRGSVVSSFLGVILIEVLSTGLAAKGVRDETKRLVTGCVIVLAAILDFYRHRWTTRRR